MSADSKSVLRQECKRELGALLLRCEGTGSRLRGVAALKGTGPRGLGKKHINWFVRLVGAGKSWRKPEDLGLMKPSEVNKSDRKRRPSRQPMSTSQLESRPRP